MVHNWSGFILIGNFFLWLGFYLTSDKIVNYHTDLNPVNFFLTTLRQAMYYGYGIMKRLTPPFHPTPFSKFNPLQLMTYQVIMLVLIPVQAVTGLLLWNLTGFANIVASLGGVRVIDTVHVLIFVFFAFYIPAHIYLGSLGRRTVTHYKEMITGYEEEDEEETKVIAAE
jgi:thiosulfate reductase cytochrome b subunit